MPGSSTTLTTLRSQIASVIGEISGLKVYASEPRQLDALPCVTMDLPTLRRVSVDDAERELGSNTWTTTWPIRVYVTADDIDYATTELLQQVGGLFAKIDARETLNGLAGVVSARLVLGEPFQGHVLAGSDVKPTIGHSCVLEVQQLV